MVHLSLTESDWSKSTKYWKELTKRIFVSLDDQKKVDFLNKVIFNLSTDNENEKKQENDLAIKTTTRTTSSDGNTSETTIKMDEIIKKFIVEPVE